MTRIVRHDSTFVVLIETILNSSIASGKEYKQKLVPTRIVDIVKEMMGSECLTGMSAQSCYRYIRAANMRLMHKTVIAPVESLNSDEI